MTQSTSDRRKAENEVIFRQHNQKIQKGLEEIQRLAEEDGQEDLIPHLEDTTLNFYCECSDENCRLRVPIKAKDYNKIHKNHRQFIILPGHETKDIEKVVSEEKDFFVVEKSIVPHLSTVGLKALNSTDANNV